MVLVQAMAPLNCVQQLSTVRVLALAMAKPDLKIVIDYLRCFPSVEILHIKVLISKPLYVHLSVLVLIYFTLFPV